MKILVLNGPNLNMLGYSGGSLTGETTLAELDKALAAYGALRYDGLELVFYQTNHEGQLVDMIQKAGLQYDGLILNPSALGSYSLILRDAVELASLPTAEVLLANPQKQDKPVERSLIGEVSGAQFIGEHLEPYEKALDFLMGL